MGSASALLTVRPKDDASPSALGAEGIRCSVPHLTAEQQADLQWLVEYGNRWSTEPATARRKACVSAVRDLSTQLAEVVETPKPAGPGPTVDLRDAYVTISVDQPADLLPWELLDLGNGPAGLVATAMARIPHDTVRAAERLAAEGPMRILIITARPMGARDVPYLAVAQHLRDLIHAHPGGIALRIVRPPTIQAFAAALADAQGVDVIHFDGHGDLRPEGPILVFEADTGGPVHIPADRFIDPIRAANPRLVVLNACRSAQAPGSGRDGAPSASVDPSLAYRIAAETGVPVVAMRYLVRADTAGRFVGALYEELLAARPIGPAVQAARRRLAPIQGQAQGQAGVSAATSSLGDGAEWLLPVLYLPGEDAPILAAPAPTRADWTPPQAALHGQDEVFLGLEKATDVGALPVLVGPVGADKAALARAFAEWRALTRGGRADAIQEQTLLVGETGLVAPAGVADPGGDPHLVRILRLEPAPRAPAVIAGPDRKSVV